MNNREALQALLDGKKIRSGQWVDKDKFLHFIKEADCIVESGGSVVHFPMGHAVWEIYEDNFDGAVQSTLDKLTRRVEELENQMEKTLGWIPR